MRYIGNNEYEFINTKGDVIIFTSADLELFMFSMDDYIQKMIDSKQSLSLDSL